MSISQHVLSQFLHDNYDDDNAEAKAITIPHVFSENSWAKIDLLLVI